MKQSRFYILFFFVVFVVCIGLFCSCLSNDDDAQWSKFNGVYVTVSGDNIRGYKLYTDFGAILVPTVIVRVCLPIRSSWNKSGQIFANQDRKSVV